MKLFRSAITLGLDIGSRSVKAVQLLKDSNGPRVISIGVAEIEPYSQNKIETIITAIKRIFKDNSFKKGQLVTALGGNSVVLKQVTFPSSSPKEIESALKWEASQYIPFPLDKVELRYQIRYSRKDQKSSEILLVAVDKVLLQNHLNLLNQINLHPKIIDVNPLALANAFLTLSGENEDNNIVMLDIGANTTILNIFRKDAFFFTRDISFGGDLFTREIQSRHNLDYTLAEPFKKEDKFDQPMMRPILNRLISELRQSLLFYDTRTNNLGYEKIILSGGGAQLPGLSHYLEENLKLPVIAFRPLKNIQIDKNMTEDDFESVESQIGVAMGLALRD